MQNDSRKIRLPLWGYVLMNVLFLAVCVLTYQLSVYWASIQKPETATMGMVPVLAVCYMSFTAVQIYDFLFDLNADRERQRAPDSEEPELIAGAQEKSRRSTEGIEKAEVNGEEQ